MHNVDSTNITAQITQVAQIIQRFFSFLSCLHLSCRVRISDAWQLEMPWHSGEVGATESFWVDSSLELLNLFPPWEHFICVFDGKLDFTRSSMANFIQIPSKSLPGQGGLGPNCQIRAGKQTQPRWIRPDPEFPCFFWWKKFPVLTISGTFLKSWTLRAERCSNRHRWILYSKLCKFETVKCGFEQREVSIYLRNIGTVSIFCLHETHYDTRVTIFNRCTVPFLQSIEVVNRQFLPDTSMDMAFLCISQSWNVLVFFGFLHIVLKCCWAASVIIPCASCSLPQGGGSMMSIFRSSSDMWCHKSFAQHFRVAAVGLGMCVILWHQCRPLQGTGNSHMHCAMRSVMFYHGRSEATIPFWPPFFSCFK